MYRGFSVHWRGVCTGARSISDHIYKALVCTGGGRGEGGARGFGTQSMYREGERGGATQYVAMGRSYDKAIVYKEPFQGMGPF